MAQTQQLINTLKKQLRAHGKTYSDLAPALGLSEASIKRLFANNNFTLQRLETACEFIGLQLAELIALMEADQPLLQQLTLKQERDIASDITLLITTVSVINGYSFNHLTEQYQLSHNACIQKLAHLDRLKIIELLPGNRIKLLTAPNFHWQPNGPIQQFFLKHIEREFFTTRFEDKSEKLLVLNGLFSQEANAELQKKMEKLAHDFNTIIQKDKITTIDKRSGVTMVLAMRDWQYKFFKKYLR